MEIKITKTNQSNLNTTDFDNLVFGKTHSDHMFVMDYKDGQWQTPEIIPYQPFSYEPNLAVFHYGQAVFEGLKAFKSAETGEIKMFRPDEHITRFNVSAKRLCMPKVDEKLFMKALKELISLDKEWVSDKDGNSLYIRPFMIATDESLGVTPSSTYKFIIFTSPASVYYADPVRLKVETEFVRSAEGGIGFAKSGGNYAASLLPAKKALDEGYNQVLWTDSKEHKYIEEAGTMNIMFQVDDVLITPQLSTSILSGITRKSVIDLAKHWGYIVEERKVEVDEILKALEEDRLQDAFGTGTAVTIHEIITIGKDGEDYQLPPLDTREFSNKVSEYLYKLKLGQAEDFMNWMETV
jgi:branched-chain amino acid aminotransferase